VLTVWWRNRGRVGRRPLSGSARVGAEADSTLSPTTPMPVVQQPTRRSGFTIHEIVVVMVIAGIAAALTMPKMLSAVPKTNVRSARYGFDALAARAHAVAVHRGCKATLNFTTGAAGRVWVTACKVSGTGIDTVGRVERLAARYGVTMTSSQSSVQYDPRGISVGYQSATVLFTSTGSSKDSAMINKLGKVVR
jgi:prepilin-type N-terminal cleavage/methylation domain-containing protein